MIMFIARYGLGRVFLTFMSVTQIYDLQVKVGLKEIGMGFKEKG